MMDKRTVIDLDRRRNDNRVCLRQLDKTKPKNTWIVMGNTFFRLETSEAKNIIQKGIGPPDLLVANSVLFVMPFPSEQFFSDL